MQARVSRATEPVVFCKNGLLRALRTSGVRMRPFWALLVLMQALWVACRDMRGAGTRHRSWQRLAPHGWLEVPCFVIAHPLCLGGAFGLCACTIGGPGLS